MKSMLVNLLVAFSILLCGFNAYQWYKEAKLHGQIEEMGSQIFRKSTEIQDLQQTVKIHQDEIKRLEGIRENFNTIVKSNRTVINQLEEQTEKFRRDAQIQAAKAAQVDQYKEAYEKANDGIRKANEVIQLQNEKMKSLADEQNRFIERYNKLAADYKSLGDDYQKVLGMYTNLVAEVNAANAKGTKR